MYSQSSHNESAGPHLVLDEDQEEEDDTPLSPQDLVASLHRALPHSTVYAVVSADDLVLATHATQRKRVTPTADLVSAKHQPPLK